MKVLSLNCQKGFNKNLEPFMQETLARGEYDFLLLQEFTEPVYVMIEPHLAGYRALRVKQEEEGEHSHLAILYKGAIALEAEHLAPMPNLHPRIIRPTAFGILTGTFVFEGTQLRLGSVHLHPGLRPGVRRAGLDYVKHALTEEDSEVPTIFGGDCNFGYSRERKKGEQLLAPEFILVSGGLEPTLDSRYTEPLFNIMNGAAAALSKRNIGVRLSTDHFFVSAALAESAEIACRVLPDRVSDHSPVELVIA